MCSSHGDDGLRVYISSPRGRRVESSGVASTKGAREPALVLDVFWVVYQRPPRNDLCACFRRWVADGGEVSGRRRL
jgi:hypothetical protein